MSFSYDIEIRRKIRMVLMHLYYITGSEHIPHPTVKIG